MKSLNFLLAFILLSGVCNAQLKVTIPNIEQNKGKVLIAIYNSETSFMNQPKAFLTVKVIVENNKASFVFKNLPKGNYAISLFHDLNGNGKLDENFFGIPTEPYGFSNNARGTFGPPSYTDSKFYYNGKSSSISIKID